jgi:hypothetical protein
VRAAYIASRSDRYPGATNIEVTWADEAVGDRRAFSVEDHRRGAAPVSGGAMMAKRPEPEIDQMLSVIAVEYESEERRAADEEAREAAASAVFSVRLPQATYQAVRAAAAALHLTPSALIRQWVIERVEEPGGDDLASAVAALRRDVDRVAGLLPRSDV